MLHFVKIQDETVYVFTNKKEAVKFQKDYNAENGAFSSDYGNERDGFLDVNHDLIMRQIAHNTGLNFDGSHSSGDKETRLHADGHYYRHLNVVAMGREVYNKWDDALGTSEVKGKGFVVYAWNDCSGYDYWLNEGTNYQQITVNIDDLGKALLHSDTIMESVDKLESELAEFSRYDLEWAGVPTPEEIEEAQNENQ